MMGDTMRKLVLAACLSLLVPISCQSSPKLATARSGMISSAHPLATEAGLRILQGGGNAFDAAVAAALSVTEPMMSGMGGYGTILIHSAKEERIRYLFVSA
jgi:gamma-glutamyltranspeptidase/glutathione hydrolase